MCMCVHGEPARAIYSFRYIAMWVDGWMDGWTDGWMDGWVDGWTDGWVDGWMDGAVRTCWGEVAMSTAKR
jgi:hypothetical protein